jgi:NitT/TauT family transport system ATP-binding protein
MTLAAMNPKIRVRDVSMAYTVRNAHGASETVEVLHGLDLDVREGEFISVLGPSGCGKSTFLSILAGLAERGGGDIQISGRQLQGVNPNQGVVFQGYALFPWRTVLENIEVGLEIRGVGRAERRRIADEYLELVGLHGFGSRYPHEISGGMKQRVAIARSLAYEPDVLLMDEPFAALDAQTREILQGELLRIWEQRRKTIVFITHSLDEAIFLSDRVAVMTRRPGAIKAILEVPLPRPRDAELRNAPEFVRLRQQAWDMIKDEVQLANPASTPRPLGATASPGERLDAGPAAVASASASGEPYIGDNRLAKAAPVVGPAAAGQGAGS